MDTVNAGTPAENLAAAHRRGVARLASVRIPLYGLSPSWAGTRLTGTTCFERGTIRGADGRAGTQEHQSVELVHEEGGRALRVESSDQVRPVDEATLLDLLDAADAEFGALPVSVDGRDLELVSARTSTSFAARGVVGDGITLTVVGRNWLDAVRLVRITDLAPYHEGRRRALEQRSGYDLGPLL